MSKRSASWDVSNLDPIVGTVPIYPMYTPVEVISIRFTRESGMVVLASLNWNGQILRSSVGVGTSMEINSEGRGECSASRISLRYANILITQSSN